MTEWERECEAEEFTRAATLYQPLSQTMAARFTSAKETDEPSSTNDQIKDQNCEKTTKVFGGIKRQRLKWQPNRVLCKHFNIPDPYPGSTNTETQKETLQTKLDEITMDCVTANVPKESKDIGNKGNTSLLLTGFQEIASQASSSKDKTNESNNKDSLKPVVNSDIIKLATQDLFKAVFADSSTESESEESDQDEQDKNCEVKTEHHRDNYKEPDKQWKQDETIQATKASNSKNDCDQNQIEYSEVKNMAVNEDLFGPALPSSTLNKLSVLSSKEKTNNEQERKTKSYKKKKKNKVRSYSESSSDDYEKNIKKEKHKKKSKKHSKSKHEHKHSAQKKKSIKVEEKHKKEVSNYLDWNDYEERTLDTVTSRTFYKYNESEYNDGKSRSQQIKEKVNFEGPSVSQSINKDIMNKLKKVQQNKEGRRMCAKDFM